MAPHIVICWCWHYRLWGMFGSTSVAFVWGESCKVLPCVFNCNYGIFEPIPLKILLNSISGEFLYTSIDKMPDGCKTPYESIGTCFETIWVYQTLETHFFNTKFQLWVQQLVLETSLFVQASLRRPWDLGISAIDYRFSIIVDYWSSINNHR